MKNISKVGDDLPYLFGQVRRLLLDTSSTPVVIFAHCTCGCDRTGEFSAAYAMQYLGATLTEARNTNVQLIKREMFYTNQYATSWYCFYLKYELAYNLTCELMGPGAIPLPTCSVVAEQHRVSYWNQGGAFYSQWSVSVTNTNQTAAIPSVTLYSMTPTSEVSNAWGYTITPGSPVITSPAHQRGLAAGQTYEWGYITKGVNPLPFLVVSPTICLNTEQPNPEVDDSCHLTLSQSVSNTWISGGKTLSQISGTLSNTSPNFPVFYVNLTLAGEVSEIWNLERVGTSSMYSLPTTSSGISPSGNLVFGYITVGSEPLQASIIIPMCHL